MFGKIISAVVTPFNEDYSIDYDSFLKAGTSEKFKSEVDEMIRHYLSLPQYKHLPVPEGFEM